MRHDIPVEDVIKALDEMSDSPLEPGNLLAISDIWLKSGYADSAMAYLERYRTANPDYDANSTYYLRLSNIYDTLGYDGKALKAYRRPCGFPWQSLYLPELSS